jgi:CheY-like chemotaxis protein
MKDKKDLKILIVDDEEIIRNFFKRFLQFYSLTGDFAENGIVALSLAKQTNYDIIFVDMTMPRMTGIDVVKELRKISSTVYIVMMTGYPVDEVIDQFKSAGASSALKKPFPLEAILDEIKNVCVL